MRQTCLLLGLLALLTISCQKEINWKNDVKFCGVSAITVRNASGIVREQFEYEYDTILRRPNLLRYHNYKTGLVETIVPVYSHDTIYYGSKVYVVTDASHRIKTLTTPDPSTGKILIYYYVYNTLGYLDQRLVDDGFNDAKRTNFTYDNGNLVSFQQDFKGYPLALSAVVSYQESTIFKGYIEYSMVELFPELVLYMPTFQLGKMSAYAIKQVETHVSNTNLPPLSLVENYSDYSISSEGWPQGYQRDMVVSGVPQSTSKYSIEYQCF